MHVQINAAELLSAAVHAVDDVEHGDGGFPQLEAVDLCELDVEKLCGGVEDDARTGPCVVFARLYLLPGRKLVPGNVGIARQRPGISPERRNHLFHTLTKVDHGRVQVQVPC